MHFWQRLSHICSACHSYIRRCLCGLKISRPNRFRRSRLEHSTTNSGYLRPRRGYTHSVNTYDKILLISYRLQINCFVFGITSRGPHPMGNFHSTFMGIFVCIAFGTIDGFEMAGARISWNHPSPSGRGSKHLNLVCRPNLVWATDKLCISPFDIVILKIQFFNGLALILSSVTTGLLV